MNDKEIKGITTELLCQIEFLKRGVNVSVPVSSYCRYDFIIDINGNLFRVQAKHARPSKTGFRISTKSTHLAAKGKNVTKIYTEDDIDFFCSFYENNCYLIPIREIGSQTTLTLLLNNDWKNAHNQLMFAEDYLIDNQLDLLSNGKEVNHVKEYVIQKFSLSGELLSEYNTVSECELCKEDIRRQSHISACINGKRKSAYGYVWKRVEK